MAEERTPEEVKREYLHAMGPELGDLVHGLVNECVWLYRKWDNFVVLFGTSPERIELLNAAAPAFFGLLQSSLWEDILLHICCLTDSPGTARKANLTLRRVPPLVAPRIRAEVAGLVKTSVDRSEFARDWRNRHIAHRDFRLVLEEPTKPLAPASRAKVKEALRAFSAALNSLTRHYMDTTVMFDKAIFPLGGAETLLHRLRDGVNQETARRKRLESGDFLPEDLDHRPL